MSPETSCPHTFSEDDGLQLEVDCSECSGAHDLKNSKCLIGIVNVISLGAEPEAIILKRFIHKRYRGAPVGRAVSAATELAALNRGLASLDQPSDKRCRTCSARAEQVVMTLRRKLIENPGDYGDRVESVVSEFEQNIALHACERARACVGKGVSFSTMLRSR